MTWYLPMDALVQLMRFLLEGTSGIHIASMIDGYNNNPGGDFRDVVNGVRKFFKSFNEN